MKHLLIILICCITQCGLAQIATIQDIDGSTNIREESHIKSQIIHTAHQGELFWYDYNDIHENKEWIKVYIPTDSIEIVGYIHNSKILTLENADDYLGNDFDFQYHLSSFDTTGREIIKPEGEWVLTIDGQSPWGTDGNIPKTQVDSISVKIHGKDIKVDREYYQNIYEVDSKLKVIKIEGFYIVHQWNCDGAGGYCIAWVFNDHGLIQRLVGSMI